MDRPRPAPVAPAESYQASDPWRTPPQADPRHPQPDPRAQSDLGTRSERVPGKPARLASRAPSPRRLRVSPPTPRTRSEKAIAPGFAQHLPPTLVPRRPPADPTPSTHAPCARRGAPTLRPDD